MLLSSGVFNCFLLFLNVYEQDSLSLSKAQEEVDRVLKGRPPTYEDIKNLKFLTRCINESLRLYPHPPVSCHSCLCNQATIEMSFLFFYLFPWVFARFYYGELKFLMCFPEITRLMLVKT